MLYSKVHTDLDTLDAHIAFLGIPYGSAYTIDEVTNDQTRAPTAVRQATDRAVRNLDRYDFDVDGPLYDGRAIKAVDCGDVVGDPRTLAHITAMRKQPFARFSPPAPCPSSSGAITASRSRSCAPMTIRGRSP